MNNFSISSFIKTGWVSFKKHWKFILLAGLATFVVDVVLQLAQHAVQGDMWHPHIIVSLIITLVSILVSIIISLGWAQVLLQIIRKDQTDWSTFKTEPVVWLRLIKTVIWYVLYLAVYLIVILVVFGIFGLISVLAHVHSIFIIAAILGYIAFIVCAVYFGVRYQFISYAVLDNPGLSSRKIFQKAGTLTKNRWWEMFGFLIVLGLMNIVGFAFIAVAFVLVFVLPHPLGLLSLILFIIGAVLSVMSIPVTKIAKAKAYDTLNNNLAHTATQISSSI